MIKKVLIANRGEIAARIMKTCRKMGIKTVAVYSDADATALHTGMADEAYNIGPPPVAQSYLNINRIIEIAGETGTDAIHPGYGLLSENPQFARRCEQAGIIFIGPDPEVIEKMGGKIQAREIMRAAGVPVVPGYEESITDVEEAKVSAARLGYPVMIKASAGGGGIGMQIVYSDNELAEAMNMCQGRAKAYFGDGSVYMEKYIANPRHIEVQVLADKYGNVIHLFERECSIQRRHQKVIEEAPSVFVHPELRQRLGEVAVRAASAINYSNAGTVEFLMDQDKNFYFLEMNTRLQVEHPITEIITGFDLVEEQILIAAGKRLTGECGKREISGHAIECRIYAEDPLTFLPAPGKITGLQLPAGDNVRNDCGVCVGYNVTPYYDPMLGKLITWGATRDEAIVRMLKALKDFQIDGLKVNIPALIDILSHPEFKAGNIHTNFIEQIIKKGVS